MPNASRYNGLWLILFTAGAIVACASAAEDDGSDNDNQNNTSGSAHGGILNMSGSPATAGKASGGTGTGGMGTSGGNSTGGAATGGAAGTGAGGGSGFACAGTKPTAPLITEFGDLMPNATNAGQFTFTAGIPGGTFAYQKGVFTLTDMAKTLNLKGNVKDFDGFGVYLGSCMDASSYDGVSFNIKGNAGPTGKLSFRFQSNATMPVDAAGKKGSCVVPAGTADSYTVCHHATYDITVAPAGGVVSVKFSDVTGGLPIATVNGKDIVGLEWAFPWNAGDTAYDVDVTLDDIKFTGGTPGGGGSGGTGGGGGTGGTQ